LDANGPGGTYYLSVQTYESIYCKRYVLGEAVRCNLLRVTASLYIEVSAYSTPIAEIIIYEVIHQESIYESFSVNPPEEQDRIYDWKPSQVGTVGISNLCGDILYVVSNPPVILARGSPKVIQ
jgi:hypothetical protein